jgi:hypothetical protein
MLVDAPARQNASATHTSASSRSNSGGSGLKGPRARPFFHKTGVNVSKALRFLTSFRFRGKPSADAHDLHSDKNRYDSMTF